MEVGTLRPLLALLSQVGLARNRSGEGGREAALVERVGPRSCQYCEALTLYPPTSQ